MKKITLAIFCFTLCFLTYAQEDTVDKALDKNEVKLNATNLIIFSYLDGSYEYLINEESSFGVGLLASFSEEEIFDEYRTFSITPYYRQYFSKKYAKGFFVEGFGMLNSGKQEYSIVEGPNQSPRRVKETYTDFALGLSIGGKFVTSRGFVAEIYLGIGRNLLENDFFVEIVGRGGISLGYRF
jgi:hypothetical protein